MRRLQVLPCPESWKRMSSDGEGRFCAACARRVTEVAQLDDAGLERLVEASQRERVCVRVELEGGRPRTSIGLAAGLLVAALAGCATPIDGSIEQAPELPSAALFDGESSGAIIAGQVKERSGVPAENALVILQSVALPRNIEVMTDERGVYQFRDLPPGNYTVQVLYGNANVSKVTPLSADARVRANFSVNPDQGTSIILGMLIERPMIDTTSASSTYSSKLTEYD